jgi:prepilin-type N-terminal cleavage/methylation domain-containing protein
MIINKKAFTPHQSYMRQRSDNYRLINQKDNGPRPWPQGLGAGFTLVELLVTIGIIGLLATVVVLALGTTRANATDKLRMVELNRMGQWLKAAGGSLGSYTAGLPAEGDLSVLFDELETRTGNKLFGQSPQDPNAPDGQTGFGYIISGGDIAIYANLQDSAAEVTLPYTAPTPGGGDGVLQGTGSWSSGLNGTDKYYQVSN